MTLGALLAVSRSQRHHPALASIVSRSSFLNGELLLGNLSETVVVHGNAPHDRPCCLVGHLVGNRASFLCTKAPMRRVPDELSRWHFPRPPKRRSPSSRPTQINTRCDGKMKDDVRPGLVALLV